MSKKQDIEVDYSSSSSNPGSPSDQHVTWANSSWPEWWLCKMTLLAIADFERWKGAAGKKCNQALEAGEGK